MSGIGSRSKGGCTAEADGYRRGALEHKHKHVCLRLRSLKSQCVWKLKEIMKLVGAVDNQAAARTSSLPERPFSIRRGGPSAAHRDTARRRRNRLQPASRTSPSCFYSHRCCCSLLSAFEALQGLLLRLPLPFVSPRPLLQVARSVSPACSKPLPIWRLSIPPSGFSSYGSK